MRKTVDPLLYDALCGIVGHVDDLLDLFGQLVWRSVRDDMTCGYSSCFHVLYADVILGLGLRSASEARQLAAVLDTVGTHSIWDNGTLDCFMTQAAKADMAPFSDEAAWKDIQATLERYLKRLQKADGSKLFSCPVANETVPLTYIRKKGFVLNA